MGAVFARLFAGFGQREVRILMIGLDASGKTTILYKLKLGEVVSTIPTIGFNVETVQHKNVKLTVWDVGGQDRIRALWRAYYLNTHGVIFVIDSYDKDRIDQACQELHQALSTEELKGAALLVLANKQDLPGAMPVQTVIAHLALHNSQISKFHVQGCCAINGEGLTEGIEWLAKNV
uniref:ADP-ribosylation factor n=1 Tax=Arcella intermedia TaxID=1963864 RepID=A0A6B2LM77_9EUKA|eukprot:TRINITY_DN7091_c0_g1_i1.p1 TRINITY_DN7091_c0_g1~~TRINITY_DN7091_c0_g1_i1.p1  ORF type:complete len:177 (-),score=39.94 TRINITY_DN7091_c0_g1_i1:122-652(-)